MNRSAKALRLAAVGVVLLFCCSWVAAQDIRYNFMPGTDFSKFKTYRWVRVAKAQYPNDILDKQIMDAIDRQLALKGLSKTDGESSDLVITYQVDVNHGKQGDSYSTSGDMGGVQHEITVMHINTMACRQVQGENGIRGSFHDQS